MPVSKETASKYDIHPQEIYATRLTILEEKLGYSYLGARISLRWERKEDLEDIVEKVFPKEDADTKEKILSEIKTQIYLKEDDECDIEKVLGRFGHWIDGTIEYYTGMEKLNLETHEYELLRF